MKKCVVSFADNKGDYRKKLKRLEQSLKGNFDGDFLGFTDYKEINCESHHVIPYKFKPYAIKKAVEMGYDLILWCDSPVVAVKPLQPVFEFIEKRGYLFFNNIGHPLGRWTNDKALEHFGITRKEAMNIKMIMACCMGFKVENLTAATFLSEYIQLADELYPGNWTDHRHDQTVASFLIYDMNMRMLEGHKTFFAYQQFYNVPELQPIADSVCLVSR